MLADPTPEYPRIMLDRADEFACFTPAPSIRKELAASWGNFSLAWSIAVQDGLEFFGNDTGMIAFARKWGFVHVLGDPLCSPMNREKLMENFLDMYPNAGFYQINTETAAFLESRGFYINEMGIDARLDLEGYDFSGKRKEHLRYASNWLAKRDYRIVEETNESLARAAATTISDQWRKTRIIRSREVVFLNRPLQANEWGTGPGKSVGLVRRFFLENINGQREAFVFFDPVMDDHKTTGYVTSFKRRTESAPAIAEVGITRYAIDVFRSEGRSHLYLGLSPLAEIENERFRKNWFLHHSFRHVFRSKLFNRYCYNLAGHAEFKKRFRGVSEKVYFASPKIVNDIRLMALLRLCRVI